MNLEIIIGTLESSWDEGGILHQLREGSFLPEQGEQFVRFIRSIYIDEQAVPLRLLQLVWYLPSFLEWQKNRVTQAGGNIDEYNRFVTQVMNGLEDVIGVP